jgi:hypothetical protein
MPDAPSLPEEAMPPEELALPEELPSPDELPMPEPSGFVPPPAPPSPVGPLPSLLPQPTPIKAMQTIRRYGMKGPFSCSRCLVPTSTRGSCASQGVERDSPDQMEIVRGSIKGLAILHVSIASGQMRLTSWPQLERGPVTHRSPRDGPSELNGLLAPRIAP